MMFQRRRPLLPPPRLFPSNLPTFTRIHNLVYSYTGGVLCECLHPQPFVLLHPDPYSLNPEPTAPRWGPQEAKEWSTYMDTSLKRKRHPPLGPPYGPRHRPTVGSRGGAVSYERGTPVDSIHLIFVFLFGFRVSTAPSSNSQGALLCPLVTEVWNLGLRVEGFGVGGWGVGRVVLRPTWFHFGT